MKETRRTEYFNEDQITEIVLDNGQTREAFLPQNPKERLAYENGFCEFVPVGYIRLVGGWFPLGYKVVTDNLKSLGLRNNPTLLTFPIGEWVFEENEVQCGDKDYGGIWSALRKGSIKTLKTHCQNTWGMETRGFLTAMFNPVFANSYRIKSQGVILLKEIK